ncbi:hypothetical protein [Alkaliphilus peptidifermentans]|uniref:SipL SPOCS domain-containing protein n=1 Tax=Alkaliphilus peptidifermentans DSM 18978 TaxID=1120976 RepID=A0A1G5G1B4_9FIRM|nr:hypothetical protein [Alkaliphilus peptidifermentans]SCY45097.1 hypothetical protein SAMN03080606_01565 [Alkaliphilus peptidifermentans DSM 18978]
MLVPTFTMSSEHLPSVELIPSNIECIKTKRLLDSCYKLEDNILIINIPREPKKIISCNIKNIKLKKNLIPSQLDDRFLAIAIYSYTIEITYIDYKKRTIIFKQLCPRYQRAFLNNTSGQLEVNLNIECIHSSIYTTILPSN